MKYFIIFNSTTKGLSAYVMSNLGIYCKCSSYVDAVNICIHLNCSCYDWQK